MIIKKIIIIFFIYSFFVFIPSTFAQISKLLFLSQVIQSAISNNSEILSESSRLDVSRAEILSASVLENPFFTFDSNLVENSFDFGVQRIFETGGLKDKRVDIATTRHKLDLINLELKKFELKNKVRAAYTKHYVNQEKLKNFRELLGFVKNLLKKKDIKDVIRFQGEVVLLEIEHNIDKAELTISQSDMNLEKLIGKSIVEKDLSLHPPDSVPAALKPFVNKNFSNLEYIPVQYIKAFALRNRLEFKKMLEFIKLSENQKRLALAKRWPLVLLEVGATVNFNEKKSRPFFSANIELPLLDRDEAEIAAADAKKDHYKKTLEILRSKIDIEVQDAYQTFKLSKKRFDRFEHSIKPEAIRHIEKLREEYDNEDISLIDRIGVEKSVLEILNTYYDALIDYQTSIIELDKAVGVFKLSPLSKNALYNRVPALNNPGQ